MMMSSWPKPLPDGLACAQAIGSVDPVMQEVDANALIADGFITGRIDACRGDEMCGDGKIDTAIDGVAGDDDEQTVSDDQGQQPGRLR